MSLEHHPALDGKVAGVGHNGGPALDTEFWYSLIDEKAAAAFLGLTDRTMQKMRQRGGGPRYSVISSRCLRYRRIDLRQWSEGRMRSSTDRVPPNHAAFQIKQQEIQDKLDDIREWVRRN